MKHTLNFLPTLFALVSLLFITSCSNEDFSDDIIRMDVMESDKHWVEMLGEDTQPDKASEVGFCWNTTGNPTTKDPKDVCEFGGFPYAGSFVGFASNLESNTTYYIRAYGIHQGKTIYGSTATVKTHYDIPASASNLTSTSATITGTAKNAGNIKEVGLSWAKWEGSTADSNFSNIKCQYHTDGTFSADLTGLDPNTFYGVRAYVINEEGTIWGDLNWFTTSN